MNDEDLAMCERCNDYKEDVRAVLFHDGSGSWELCPACRRAVRDLGEEPEDLCG